MATMIVEIWTVRSSASSVTAIIYHAKLSAVAQYLRSRKRTGSCAEGLKEGAVTLGEKLKHE
jgi:hypothetical protein